MSRLPRCRCSFSQLERPNNNLPGRLRLAASFRMSRGWLPWTRQVGRSRAHWLGDQWRGWLDATEHAWWRRGILASLRTDHRTSGAGREERLVASIEKLSEELHRKYSRPPMAWLRRGSSIDDDDGASSSTSAANPRASCTPTSADLSHVRHACRTLASYRVLSPYVTDREKLLRSLRDRNGDESTARKLLRAGVSFSLHLSKDPAQTASRMLRAMAYDHGDVGWGWEEGSECEGDVVAELRTSRCLYVSLFSKENAQDLATATCCAVDGVPWFPADAHATFGVRVSRLSALSEGDRA